jgi:DNA-binding response OmpR family regulator
VLVIAWATAGSADWHLHKRVLRRSGRVVPKSAIHDAIYAYGEEPASNAIEILVHRLRKRLREVGAAIEIHTVRGVGYMLTDTAPRGTRLKAVGKRK